MEAILGYGVLRCSCCKGKRYIPVKYQNTFDKPSTKEAMSSFNNVVIDGKEHPCPNNPFNTENSVYGFIMDNFIPYDDIDDQRRNTLKYLSEYFTYENLIYEDDENQVFEAKLDPETGLYKCPICGTELPGDVKEGDKMKCPNCTMPLVIPMPEEESQT